MNYTVCQREMTALGTDRARAKGIQGTGDSVGRQVEVLTDWHTVLLKVHMLGLGIWLSW